MANYRAIVTFEFSDEDLTAMGFEEEDPHDVLFGELQTSLFSDFWINQIYRNEKPTIANA